MERVLADAHAAAAYAERAFKNKVDALGADARRQQERLEAQLVLQRIEQESQRVELQERSAAIARERDRLQQSLAVAEDRSRQLDVELQDVRVHLDEVRNAADAESRQLKAGLAESERLLAEVRTQHQAEIDQLFSDHTSVVSGHRSEIQQLQAQLAAAAGDLDGTTAALERRADQGRYVAAPARELEESRAEIGRLFQQSALAMFRCTRNGEVTQANRAAMTLVGRRSHRRAARRAIRRRGVRGSQRLVVAHRSLPEHPHEGVDRDHLAAQGWRPSLRAPVGVRLRAGRDRESSPKTSRASVSSRSGWGRPIAWKPSAGSLRRSPSPAAVC